MKKSLLIAFIMVTFCVYSNAFAQQTEEIEVTSCSGDVQVLLKDTEEYTEAEEGIKLQAGDKIKTGENATVELSFNEDNSNLVRLSENTSTDVLLKSDQKLDLTEGEIFSSISNLPSGSSFEIRTPTAVSGARGTEWVTKITEEGTEVEAIDAVPYVRHYKGEGALSPDLTLVQAGHMTTIRKLQVPTPPRPMLAERTRKFQALRQDMRRHAQDAIIKRSERQPFDRSQFKEKLRKTREGMLNDANNLKPLMSREGNKPFTSDGRLGNVPLIRETGQQEEGNLGNKPALMQKKEMMKDQIKPRVNEKSQRQLNNKKTGENAVKKPPLANMPDKNTVPVKKRY